MPIIYSINISLGITSIFIILYPIALSERVSTFSGAAILFTVPLFIPIAATITVFLTKIYTLALTAFSEMVLLGSGVVQSVRRAYTIVFKDHKQAYIAVLLANILMYILIISTLPVMLIILPSTDSTYISEATQQYSIAAFAQVLFFITNPINFIITTVVYLSHHVVDTTV